MKNRKEPLGTIHKLRRQKLQFFDSLSLTFDDVENRQKSWFFDGLSVSFDDVVYEWSLITKKALLLIRKYF